jgi:hypothetical protein
MCASEAYLSAVRPESAFDAMGQKPASAQAGPLAMVEKPKHRFTLNI